MDQNNQYTLSNKTKMLTNIFMGVGLVTLMFGIYFALTGEHSDTHTGDDQRLWSNILINGIFFFGIALAASFFLAVQYASQAGWSSVYKRIMEAVATYLPFGGGVIILVLAVGSFLHGHHLYHWMDPNVYLPEHDDYDALIAHKKPYFETWFYWLRTLTFLVVWFLFTRWFRKRSLAEDVMGTIDYQQQKKLHVKNVAMAAGFLVFFGYTSMVASWDWIMSIDTHWFSTIFGWYVFAGMWISGIITVILITLHLKKLGHLPEINANHLHDMGKWMFAISFLWSYLFFCQFMLIWYSNIPEEVTYYLARIEDYSVVFWLTFLINFILPMVFLMSKDAKRNGKFLFPIGVIIFIGHWLDTYMMITPGTMKAEGSIGWLEIGMAIGFLGLFIRVVMTSLSKAPLLAKQHPYLEESLHHQVQ